MTEKRGESKRDSRERGERLERGREEIGKREECIIVTRFQRLKVSKLIS